MTLYYHCLFYVSYELNSYQKQIQFFYLKMRTNVLYLSAVNYFLISFVFLKVICDETNFSTISIS